MSLTHAQEIEFKEAFALFDPSNTGKIQPEAFRRFLQTFGDERLTRSVRIPTQPLDFKAFSALLVNKHKGPETSAAAYQKLFYSINQSDSGSITAGELRIAVTRFMGAGALSAADIDEVILEADVSGDGRITVEEFVKVLEKSEKKLRGEWVL